MTYDELMDTVCDEIDIAFEDGGEPEEIAGAVMYEVATFLAQVLSQETAKKLFLAVARDLAEHMPLLNVDMEVMH